jgi:hypothetical protein
LDRGSPDAGRRLLALWTGVLAGPLVWAALLEANYVMSYVACEQRHSWMLHLATAVALGLIALAACIAWRAAPAVGHHDRPSTEPGETGLLRARFMVVSGLGLCAFFALVIIATDIPVLVLNPCSW